MSLLDPLVLARIQFAFTVSFHILFPAFSIGLASYLAVLEGMWLRTKREEYYDLYKFWVKIFAVSFGMGVVSGVVMSYQFGTNWSRFADAVGPVMGPVMSYEVLTAFFLEAGFLGIALFGLKKVGPGLHFFATCMVALGTLTSAFWILSANSWMHTPAGYVIVDGRFEPQDWFKIVFNPSFPYRFVHMVLAAYLTTAFAVGAVGAWHLLCGRRDWATRRMFSMAMWMAALVAPLQIAAGDMHGLNTLEYEPAKIAAMEGSFDRERGAPELLFGIPDMGQAVTRYALGIPHLGSLILTHSWNGETPGLKSFPRQNWPNATLLFFSFRAMVGLGFLMFGVGLISLFLRWRGTLFERAWFHRVAIATGPAGFIAILCGWVTTEAGRQPWVVHGLMRTADAVSPLAGASVGISLAAFFIAYAIVFATGTVYMLRLMAHDPSGRTPTGDDSGGRRPLAAADEPYDRAVPAE